MSNLRNLSIIVLISLSAALAFAQEKVDLKDKIKVIRTPATKPVATPATRPAPAAVSPETQAALDTIAKAYGDLKALELEATMSLKVDAKEPATHTASYKAAWRAPNFFKQTGDDQPMLISTGEKVYAYIEFFNVYKSAAAPAGKAALTDLPADLQKTLPGQNLSLVLALAKDPALELRSLCSALALGKGEGDQVVLEGKLNAGQPVTLVFDGKTHLLSKYTLDMKGDFEKMKRPDVKSAVFSVTYTSSRADAAPEATAFAWKPPVSARELAGAAAPGGLMIDSEDGPGNALAGQPAPDFTLTDIRDREITLSKLKGQVVLLDFWATWCGPCVASMPQLQKLHEELGGKGLTILAVNQGEGKELAAKFMEKKDLTFNCVLDADKSVGSKLYGVRGIPTQVVIGKDGVVKKVNVGFNPAGEAALKKLIEDEIAK